MPNPDAYISQACQFADIRNGKFTDCLQDFSFLINKNHFDQFIVVIAICNTVAIDTQIKYGICAKETIG